MKKPSFCEKFGSQIKFCTIQVAYVIYEGYLIKNDHKTDKDQMGWLMGWEHRVWEG